MKKSAEYKAIVEMIESEVENLKADPEKTPVLENEIEKLTEKAATVSMIIPHLEIIEDDNTWNDIEKAEYERLASIAEDALAA